MPGQRFLNLVWRRNILLFAGALSILVPNSVAAQTIFSLRKIGRRGAERGCGGEKRDPNASGLVDKQLFVPNQINSRPCLFAVCYDVNVGYLTLRFIIVCGSSSRAPLSLPPPIANDFLPPSALFSIMCRKDCDATLGENIGSLATDKSVARFFCAERWLTFWSAIVGKPRMYTQEECGKV